MPRWLKTAVILIAWGGFIAVARSGLFQEHSYSLPMLFLLVSVGCAFFPLPTNVLVLVASQDSGPGVSAAVAILATPIAFALEHFIYTLIIRRGKVLDVGKLKLFPKLFAAFARRPFSALVLAAFLPVPTEPIRLYAISAGYRRWPYVLAGGIGRIPRYVLVAWLGKLFGAPAWLVAATLLLPLVLTAANYLARKGVQTAIFLLEARWRKGEAANVGVSPTQAEIVQVAEE